MHTNNKLRSNSPIKIDIFQMFSCWGEKKGGKWGIEEQKDGNLTSVWEPEENVEYGSMSKRN